MFEKEIKFIKDISLNKIRTLGAYFTVEQLAYIDIHPAILKYINGEIDFLIFEDRQKILRNSIFDYSGQKIDGYLQSIGFEIKKNKKFSFDYMSNLVLHAVSFNVNYLTRPSWTLQKFLFDENESKPVAEIKYILNYLYYYDFLKQIIFSYLEKKKIITITSREFAELLHKINEIGSKENQIHIVSSAVKSIVEFMNIGNTSSMSSIASETLEVFLKDVNYVGILNKFQIKSKINESDRIDINEFIRLLKTSQSVERMSAQPASGMEKFEKNKDGINVDLKTLEIINQPVIKEEFIDISIEKRRISIGANGPVLEIEKRHPAEIRMQAEKVISKTVEIPEADNKLLNKIRLNVPISEFSKNNSLSIKGKTASSEEEKMVEDVAEQLLKIDVSYKESEENEIVSDTEEYADIDDLISESEIYSTGDEEFIFMEDESAQSATKEVDLSEDTSEINELKTAEVENEESIENQSTYKVDFAIDTNEMEKLAELPLENKGIPSTKAEEDYSFQIVEDETNEEFNLIEKKIQKNALIDDGPSLFSHQRNENLPVSQNKTHGLKYDGTFTENKSFGNDTDSINYELLSTIEEQENTDNEDYSKDKIGEISTSGITKSEIDLSVLLEHKKMDKIIEYIFDYDMEDFANIIDEVAECENEKSAMEVLDYLYDRNQVKPKSKEAVLFKAIISQFFKKE